MSAWSAGHAAELLRARAVLLAEADPAWGEAELAQLLYGRWYCARRDPSVGPVATAGGGSSVGEPSAEPPLSSAARAMHAGAQDYATEAEVVATGVAGVCVVRTRHGRRALGRGEYATVSGRAGMPPQVGDRVRVHARLGAVVQAGWWRTWGAGWQRETGREISRVYLHPRTGRGPSLVRAVTAALPLDGDWLMKIAPTQEGLARPDAAVVYLGGALAAERATVVTAVAGLTDGDPPPLTARVAPGVGWAQQPDGDASFGESRCAAVAAGHLATSPGDSPETWLTIVAHAFTSSGIDCAAPHLASQEMASQEMASQAMAPRAVAS